MQDLVEQSTIDRLSALGARSDDPGFVKSMVHLYLEHTPGLVVSLKRAFEAGDLTEAARLAHRIKGSSASIGAKALAEHCTVVEKALRTPTAADAVNSLATILDETVARLRILQLC